MSRSTAIQRVLEQEIKLTNSTAEITHTGDYAQQKSIGLRYMRRNGVYYAEKTTWVVSTGEGIENGSTPSDLFITKVDNDSLTAVTRRVNITYPDNAGASLAKLRDYLNNAMVTSDDTFITAFTFVNGGPLAPGRDIYIQGAGMEGNNAYSWSVNITNDFKPPEGTTVSEDLWSVTTYADTGHISVVVLRSYWGTDPRLIHEIMRRYTISASGAVVNNELIHHKVYPPAGTGTPIGFAIAYRVSPTHYVYRSSSYEFPGNLIDRTYLRDGITDAVLEEVIGGAPQFTEALSDRNNNLYSCRPFLSDTERPLIGGRYITMTTGMPNTYNGHKLYWESSSGGIKHATIPFRGGTSNVIRPYIVLGISPNDDIYIVWYDGNTSKEILAKYDSSGNLVWDVTKEDWPYTGWDYLITYPVTAIRASPGTGTSEDSLCYNNRMLFDTKGRPVLLGTQAIPASATQGRTPYTRVILDPDTGKPIKAPVLGTVPAISGKVGLAIADIMSYNSVTDTAKQTFLIANTQSTSPISTTATLGKMRRMSVDSKLLLYISVKDADGKILDYSSYNLEVTVDDAYAWPNYDSANKVHYIELKPGQNWKVTVKSQRYVKSEKTGTFGNDNQSVDIIMHPKDWSRNSYEIYTPQDLIDMRKDSMGLYTLMNDIDMSGIEWETPFTSTEEAFMGSLNGNGYTIKNLIANNENGGYTALCGVVQNGVFYDIAFENCNMYGSSGHALGVLSGFVLVAPLFYNEDPPSSYEELDTYFHNISFKNCSLRQKYSYSGSGMLFGEMSWSKPVIHGTVINNIEVNKCRLIGGEYGSDTLGGAWGSLSIASAGSDE